MKYLKTYESQEELKNSLKSLSDSMSRLKTLVKVERRIKNPSEIYEDYFLEFKDFENFRLDIYRNNNGIGPIHFKLSNMIDKDIIESEFNRYLSKLKSIQSRLEYAKYDCLFSIKLNGRSQSDLDPIRHKNDDYKFKGLGDSYFGYDKKFVYSNSRSQYRNTTDLEFPDDKVSFIIDFYII